MKKIVGGLCCLLLAGSLWAQTASRIIQFSKKKFHCGN